MDGYKITLNTDYNLCNSTRVKSHTIQKRFEPNSHSQIRTHSAKPYQNTGKHTDDCKLYRNQLLCCPQVSKSNCDRERRLRTKQKLGKLAQRQRRNEDFHAFAAVTVAKRRRRTTERDVHSSDTSKGLKPFRARARSLDKNRHPTPNDAQARFRVLACCYFSPR